MRKNLLSFSLILALIGAIFVAASSVTGLLSTTAIAGSSGMWSEAGKSPLRYASEKRYVLKSISANPDNLLKIMGQDVKTALQEPELVRADLPTVIWQYRNDFCVLDIYFTAEEDPNYSPVVHYEIRSRDTGVADEQVKGQCVRAMVSEQQRPQMVDVSAIYKTMSQ